MLIVLVMQHFWVHGSSLTVLKSRLKTHLFHLAHNDRQWLTWSDLLCHRYRNVCIIIIIIIVIILSVLSEIYAVQHLVVNFKFSFIAVCSTHLHSICYACQLLATEGILFSGCGHILEVCEHDILQTARDNFIKFTTKVQLGTKMNWLYFEVKRSKVLVTVSQNMVINHWFKNVPFRWRHTVRQFTVEYFTI